MSIARRMSVCAAVCAVVSTGSACHRAAVPASVTPASVATPPLTDSTVAAVAVVEVTPPVPRARVPRDAARFEIDAVDDSTARFKPREASWVKPGMDAYIVDPLHRDALVARVRVTSIWNETAIAVVTSQVTRVTNQQVVLMVPPSPTWTQRHRYWLGVVTGALIGGTIGALAGR